ncbi:MAG: hypothetical protein HQL09_03315 [Nitrospirae bacterium]|nr:hypothetical protein [Nitrospirota bacterium]
MEPIGIIHTPYKEKNECPIQPLYAPDVIGRVEVFEKYAAGLKDIETFFPTLLKLIEILSDTSLPGRLKKGHLQASQARDANPAQMPVT